MERPRIANNQETEIKKTPKNGVFESEEKTPEEIDLERRRLLKAAMFLVTGIVAGSASRHGKNIEESVGFLERVLTNFRNRKSKEIDKKPSDSDEKKESIDYVEINNPGNFEKEVSEEDAVTVRDLVNFDSRETIKLGSLEIDKIQKNWEKRYYEGDKKRDLDEALLNMKNWEGPAKETFMAEGEAYCRREKIAGAEKAEFLTKFSDYFYLSIPESYWRLTDKSCANAVGPFQFMEKTAREYGLKLDEGEEKNFDERRDPIKSANAAARFLLRLNKKMDRNWDLALSNYNGGFARKFKEEKASNQNLDYPNFLEYLRRKIERLKKELSSVITLTHEVIKNKDSLEKIAKLYGLEEKTLATMNKLKVGDEIKVGDKIIIPPTQENRRKNFYYHVDGFSQNINYPAKLYAVLAVIKKREGETGRALLNQKSSLPEGWKEKLVRQQDPYFNHIVTNKDTLSGLAKKYSVSSIEICQKNNLKKPYLLVPGKVLNIRNTKKPITLATLAPPGKLELMKKINPAIKNANEPLPSLKEFPDGITIRFPAK